MGRARDEAGNIWETDAQGNPLRLLAPAGGPQMPADPAFPYQGPKAAADVVNTQANATGQTLQNAVTQATIPDQIAKAKADARKAQIDADNAAADAAGKPNPQSVKATRNLQLDEVLNALGRAKGEVSGWTTGFPGQILSGVGGTDARDLAGDLSTIGSALTVDKLMQMKSQSQTGASGMGALSEKEGQLLRDSVASLDQSRSQDKVKQSLAQIELHYRRLMAIQDGQNPDDPQVQKTYGIGAALLGSVAANGANGGNGGGPTGGGSPVAPPAAPAGSSAQSLPIPPEMQAAHAQYLAQHWGHIDPNDYANFRAQLDKQFGFAPRMDAYKAIVPDLNKRAEQGGAPDGLNIPSVNVPLTGFAKFRNDVVNNPFGAGVAAAANAGGFGIPSLMAHDQFAALGDAQPVGTVIGDVAGGLTGTALAGKGLGLAASKLGNPLIAKALANPLTADVLYGTTYGGTQGGPEGAAVGAVSGLTGGMLGKGMGHAFPKLFNGKAIQAAEDAVPTVPQLKSQAKYLYDKAEANGVTAAPQDTQGLANSMSGILTAEGRLSPSGRLSDVNPKVKDAYQLVSDYAGQQMTPTQLQSVRSVLADGLSSPDASERRIAGMMLKTFDQWAATKVPGLDQARATASRYLQAGQIQKAQELAGARAGQFSGSGYENALRTEFRQIDRNAIKNGSNFSQPLLDAVENVSRGTPVSNVARGIGKLAPTGVVPIGLGGGLPFSVGNAMGGPAVGGALAGTAMTLGALGRKAATSMGVRNAEIAELIARDPAFAQRLSQLTDYAAGRGARIGGGLFGATSVIPFSQ